MCGSKVAWSHGEILFDKGVVIVGFVSGSRVVGSWSCVLVVEYTTGTKGV